MLRIHVANMIRYFNKWGWFADRERRRFNRMLLEELPRIGRPEDGRGEPARPQCRSKQKKLLWTVRFG